jgi:hypothetical protein
MSFPPAHWIGSEPRDESVPQMIRMKHAYSSLSLSLERMNVAETPMVVKVETSNENDNNERFIKP